MKNPRIGKRGPATVAKERRARELLSIKKYGRWAFDRHTWAKKEKVSEQTIDDDLQWLRKNCIIDLIDAEESKFELHDGLKELLIQARQKALSADDENQRIRWTAAYERLADRFIKFLEDFGMKETYGRPEGETMRVITPEMFMDAYEEAKEYDEKSTDGRRTADVQEKHGAEDEEPARGGVSEEVLHAHDRGG